ncbi:MAG: hypothetical protein IJ759_02840 [Bacteroidales bacterium]|nr:hypothetical protein [Bacteroidales bacterium]
MKKRLFVILIALINTYFVFAVNTSKQDKYDNILSQAAQEVDKIFGTKEDEYTVIIGADFLKGDSVNKFVYYYVVSSEIWSDLLEATDVLKEELRKNLKESVSKDEDFSLFIDMLIENGSELCYNYECKNEYFAVEFSWEELRQLKS